MISPVTSPVASISRDWCAVLVFISCPATRIFVAVVSPLTMPLRVISIALALRTPSTVPSMTIKPGAVIVPLAVTPPPTKRLPFGLLSDMTKPR